MTKRKLGHRLEFIHTADREAGHKHCTGSSSVAGGFVLLVVMLSEK